MIRTEDLLNKRIDAYLLTSLLGKGRRGSVFLARPNGAPAVALKIFSFAASSTEDWSRRFPLYCKKLSELQHPHILPVQTYGIQDKLMYITMPYIEQGTLREYLRHRGPLTPSDAFVLIDQISRALDFAHEHDVAHGNIHSGNVLLKSRDFALLSDFNGEEITPERSAADLAALGKLLYEIVTGQPASNPPAPPHTLIPTLVDEVEQVLLRALSSDITVHYSCAQDLADEFSSAVMEMLMHRRERGGTLYTQPSPAPEPASTPGIPESETFQPSDASATQPEANAPPDSPAKPETPPQPVAPPEAMPPLRTSTAPGEQAPTQPMSPQPAAMTSLAPPTNTDVATTFPDTWETMEPSRTHIYILFVTIFVIVLLSTMGLWLIYTQSPQTPVRDGGAFLRVLAWIIPDLSSGTPVV